MDPPSQARLTNTSVADTPGNNLISSVLLFGTFALQTVFGRNKIVKNSGAQNRQPVDDFIAVEAPIALERLLCNIGSNGCAASGVPAGVVIASPDTSDPDYFYTWTRDSGLVFKSLVDRFTETYDADLQQHIQEYIAAQAWLQGISNPSGSFDDGSGLAEPKFEADMTAFTGSWGRPQRDGPALRSLSLIAYARWLMDNSYESTATEIVWPIIRNDLEYVAQYWNNTGFDLWEEVDGSSFFTISTQYKALVEGASLAARLDPSEDKYSDIAPHILCFLQRFWNSEEGYIISNINTNIDRTGKDTNSILGSTHTFDPTLGCDAESFQPCSDRSLSNLKNVVDSFRSYNINSGIPRGSAIAIGRYAEDVYYKGNPWYLCTLSAAELLYDAIYVWKNQGFIPVTEISLGFFRDLVPEIQVGSYRNDSSEYEDILESVWAYADGFIAIVAKFIEPNGSMREQYSKDDGTPVGATTLTWSYSAFLTATARRRGIIPPSWAGDSKIPVPQVCEETSAIGWYWSATATSFPDQQTPGPSPPASTTSSSPLPCATVTAVNVTFMIRARTEYGWTIKVAGNITELGNWEIRDTAPLDASEYTHANPIWMSTLPLDAGASIQYKYINVGPDGSVIWERGSNRMYTVPQTCSATAIRRDTWDQKCT